MLLEVNAVHLARGCKAWNKDVGLLILQHSFSESQHEQHNDWNASALAPQMKFEQQNSRNTVAHGQGQKAFDPLLMPGFSTPHSIQSFFVA